VNGGEAGDACCSLTLPFVTTATIAIARYRSPAVLGLNVR
jgi:hypothetical protein